MRLRQSPYPSHARACLYWTQHDGFNCEPGPPNDQDRDPFALFTESTARPLSTGWQSEPPFVIGVLVSDVISRQVFPHHGELPMLLTFSQAAGELGFSLRTVQRLVARGTLRAVEVDTGNAKTPTRRIRREDLQAFVCGLARSA